MQGVEDTFRTIYGALTDAVKFFCTGVAPNGVPLTQQQAVDVLDVYDTFLAGREADVSTQVHLVSLSFESGFIGFLADTLSKPFEHVHEFDAQVPQPFLALRMKALKTIQQLLTLCGDLGELWSTRCFRFVMEEELLPKLLQTLSLSPHETLRSGVTEALFIFVLRIRDGSTGLVACSGINVVCRSLLGDKSDAVRSLCASLLREVVNTHAGEFINPSTIAVIMKGLGDSSEVVRALSAEIIDYTMRFCPSNMSYVLQDSQNPFVHPLQHIFEQDPSVEVVESAAHLLETCCEMATSVRIYSFFVSWMSVNFVKTLLQRLREGGNASVACARSLRLLIQHTPASYELPQRILRDHELLAILLKGIVDAGRGRTTAGEDYTAFQIKSVELALALAIILSQAAAYREHLAEELRGFPQWAAAIKNAALSLLDAASLDYFTGIELVDITGFHLNALHGVEWCEDDAPSRAYVCHLFQVQVSRLGEKRNSVNHDYAVPIVMEADMQDKEQQRRKVRLTFMVLVLAISTTFPVGSQAAVEVTNHDAPHVSQSRAMRRLIPRFSSCSQTCSRQPEELLRCTSGSSPSCVARIRPDMGTEDEREAVAIAYDKFDSAMSLVMKYTQHYSPRRPKDDTVETDDGYLVRMSRLKNPWHAIIENQRLKTWQLSDLKMNDLFYFSLPFENIGPKAIDAVAHKARRHMLYVKRQIATTPQGSKGRRWFLYDMMKNIMPKVQLLLSDLKALLNGRDGDAIRFPIFLFREKELHFGERALHPGNLLDVIDQIRFYFLQGVEKTLGVDSARLQQLAQELDSIDKGAGAGGSKRHCGEEEEDGYGHGTISSESEADD